MLFIMMIVLACSSVDDFNLIKFINDEDDNSNLELIPVDMDKSVYFEENVNVEGVNNSDTMLRAPPNILSPQTSYEEITDNNLENMCSNIENSDFFECLEKTLKELISNNIDGFTDNSHCEEHIKSPENQNNENNLENENSYISIGRHSDKDNVQENINPESQINYINDNNDNLHNIEIFDSNETWMEVIPIPKENENNSEIPSSSRNNSTNIFQNIKLIEIIYTKNKIDLSEMHLLHEKKINGRVEYILNLASQNLSNIQVITFKNIQHLNLDHNDLSYIPNEIFNLHSLKSLSLENNKISKIPYEINKLQSLKKLNVDKNQLTNVIEINNLLYLSIQYNKIRCLNHVNKIKSLIKLKIDNNYINIDKLNINNLEFLSLSNIKQTSLIFLKNLNKLKILDCS
ncbi:Leucine rich repeat protein, partial [Spraguea lophii 42_110]